jgi:hypothetical protein
MAPGTFNGHNFGGLHTGTGKYNNSGIYANGGYRYQHVSHLTYKPGEKVIYLGSQRNVPYGTSGIIVKKDRKDKVARSLVKIDFKEYGVCFVYKKNLLKEGEYESCIQKQLDKTERHKLEPTQRMKLKQQEKKLKLFDKSRKVRKDYREKRKELNNQNQLELDQFLTRLSNKYSTKNPIGFLLDKKSYVGSGNEYSKDYTKYMKLVSYECIIPREPRETTIKEKKQYNHKKKEVDISRFLWGLH